MITVKKIQESQNQKNKNLIEDFLGSLTALYGKVEPALDENSKSMYDEFVSSILETDSVKYMTRDMITVYYEDGRYHITKDSRNGNKNYNLITGLTRNDLIHIKQAIEDMLRRDSNEEESNID